MEIVVTTAHDGDDYRDYLKIEINEKTVFSAMDGEPEDNNLSRNFNDCFSITDLMKLAYKAGAAAEPMGITTQEIDWEEI